MKWLGPLDDIPDMDVQPFLKIIHHDKLQLDHKVVVRPSYIRIVNRFYNPSDPHSRRFPIILRDQGTMVDAEAIREMLGIFERTEQDFRDAYNDILNFSQPTDLNEEPSAS